MTIMMLALMAVLVACGSTNDKEEVEQLYKEMGEVFRPLKTWSKYILTSDLNFEAYYGEKATKKRKLYNGALRTDYFQYWGERPPKPKRK